MHLVRAHKTQRTNVAVHWLCPLLAPFGDGRATEQQHPWAAFCVPQGGLLCFLSRAGSSWPRLPQGRHASQRAWGPLRVSGRRRECAQPPGACPLGGFRAPAPRACVRGPLAADRCVRARSQGLAAGARRQGRRRYETGLRRPPRGSRWRRGCAQPPGPWPLGGISGVAPHALWVCNVRCDRLRLPLFRDSFRAVAVGTGAACTETGRTTAWQSHVDAARGG